MIKELDLFTDKKYLENHNHPLSGADLKYATKVAKDYGNNCTLYKPLLMVIPPDGCYIKCAVHGEHYIRGSKRPWL